MLRSGKEGSANTRETVHRDISHHPPHSQPPGATKEKTNEISRSLLLGLKDCL